MAYLSSGFARRLWAKHMKNYVTLSEAALKSAMAIPWDFTVFKKSMGSLVKFPEISLIFPGKAISLLPECVGTLANSGGRYSIYVGDVSGIAAPSPAIYDVTMRSSWLIQEYANGSFVSNNNIVTIPFLNTYYHKQMKKILISAYNETFRQSSDPVYAHTPVRNVGELRTFNPKLKDSAGGEVNDVYFQKITESQIWGNYFIVKNIGLLHNMLPSP